MLAHAVASSPYYREALGPRALSADVRLDELPVLSKTTLMEQWDRIVTDPRLRLDAVTAHLSGPAVGDRFAGGYRVFATSGSTGEPGVFVYAEDEWRWWIAHHLRVFARVGLRSDLRLAAIGAPSPVHLSRQLFDAFRTEAPRLSVATPLGEATSALDAYEPEALIGYPSILAMLADEQLGARLQIAPRLVGGGGEVLTEEMRQRIEAAWGVTPFEVYATTEVPLIAISGSDRLGLRTSDDLVIVEVVDADGHAVPPGVPGDLLLVTSLVNRAQPLIRYAISDVVTLAADDDPAGMPFQRIAGIEGRTDDIISLPGRDGHVVTVHPQRLRAPFVILAAVRQYQVFHDERGLEVRIVLQADAPRDTVERVRLDLGAAIEATGAIAPPVSSASSTASSASAVTPRSSSS